MASAKKNANKQQVEVSSTANGKQAAPKSGSKASKPATQVDKGTAATPRTNASTDKPCASTAENATAPKSGEAASQAAPAPSPLDPATLSPRDEAIVSCAAQVFLARGIADVKMTEIANAAQVGVATLYRRFSTKIDLAILAATSLWRSLNEDIQALVASPDFAALSGLARLDSLLCSYRDTYLKRADFMRFLDELDHVVVSEHVEPACLVVYGAEVDSFYPVFYDAYRLGLEDGSVTCMVDFPTFYHALAHALTSTAQKLSRGEVIPSDDFGNVRTELNYLIFMAKCTLTATSL